MKDSSKDPKYVHSLKANGIHLIRDDHRTLNSRLLYVITGNDDIDELICGARIHEDTVRLSVIETKDFIVGKWRQKLKEDQEKDGAPIPVTISLKDWEMGNMVTLWSVTLELSYVDFRLDMGTTMPDNQRALTYHLLFTRK